MQLLRSSTIIGPVMLLIWRDGNGDRSHAMLTAFATDLRAFRKLRGRFRLEADRLNRAVDEC